MGASKTSSFTGTKAGRAGVLRVNTSAFYRILRDGALELGEVARIEIEIQKYYPHMSPQPHCPNCHRPSSARWQASPPH